VGYPRVFLENIENGGVAVERVEIGLEVFENVEW
jgi:hypothetical protein